MKRQIDNDNAAASIADLMSALMIIFLFISVSFMLQISKEKEQISNIAENYRIEKQNMTEIASKFQITKYAIYQDLLKEFKNELTVWNAEIDRQTLSVRFKEPDIFFKTGDKQLNNNFKRILDDFFPRYIKILSQDKYKDEIEEIRIEGHTSSEWSEKSTPLESYFKNMALSQARTRSVLEYVMSLSELRRHQEFLISKVTANGLSYSQRIIKNGKEDFEQSRRVEFRIRTTAEKHIEKILLGGANETN